MTERRAELVQECKRESENCLYTSTAMFIWLRRRRKVKNAFIILPLILGSFATWEIVSRSGIEWVRICASAASFLAGLFPAVYAALKYDDDLEKLKTVAAEFKNLQDRFRQVALFYASKSIADFEAQFEKVMSRMEEARSQGMTPPEWSFKAAQAKVKSGDYTFDVDLPKDQN